MFRLSCGHYQVYYRQIDTFLKVIELWYLIMLQFV